jgi:TPR repeat protein|tara:strand:+ start:112 stop:846 length:735 start_codon:yes stop_codon:yes gene_type:complete
MALVAVCVFSPVMSCNTMGIMSKINEINAPSLGLRALSCALVLTLPPSLLADYEDGVNAAFKGDFETALHEFTLAAEEGLDLAQYNLAILYFTGQGVVQDAAEAFRWTELAAQQGHVAAQFNLGSLYYAGDGVEADTDKAVEMFEGAARAGHAAAALILANMYADGELTPDVEPGLFAQLSSTLSSLFSSDQNNEGLVLAHVWANVAIANDSSAADALRVNLEGRMSGEQLSQARRQFALQQIE